MEEECGQPSQGSQAQSPLPLPPPQPPSLNTRLKCLEQKVASLVVLFVRQFGSNQSMQQPQTTLPSQILQQPRDLPQPQAPQQPQVVPQSQPEGMHRTVAVDMVKRFLELNPPEFKGTKDPIVAEWWIMKIEKLLKCMGCNDAKRVPLATFMLEDEAECWWEYTRTVLVTRHRVITWDVFLESFYGQYIPGYNSKKTARGEEVDTGETEQDKAQSKRQKIDAPCIQTVEPMIKPTCPRCGKPHGTKPCHLDTRACFKCGKKGHRIKDCPTLRALERQTKRRGIGKQKLVDKDKRPGAQGKEFTLEQESGRICFSHQSDVLRQLMEELAKLRFDRS